MNKEDFKKIRLKISVRQRELAEMLGVKAQTIGSYERGERNITQRIADKMLVLEGSTLK